MIYIHKYNKIVSNSSDVNDYDEGRAKIVEYLYNEYSLEEILYKLAKVFTKNVTEIWAANI